MIQIRCLLLIVDNKGEAILAASVLQIQCLQILVQLHMNSCLTMFYNQFNLGRVDCIRPKHCLSSLLVSVSKKFQSLERAPIQPPLLQPRFLPQHQAAPRIPDFIYNISN